MRRVNGAQVVTHRLEKVRAQSSRREVFQVEFACIRGDSSKDESVRYKKTWVRRPVGALGQFQEAGTRICLLAGPVPRRRHQCLGFPDHLAALPVSDHHKARTSETATALLATCESGYHRTRWQRSAKRGTHLGRRVGIGAVVDLLPELAGGVVEPRNLCAK